MTPQQIIENARIPGTQSILVLGSFEKRVTVYAQQVRALNLVDAMLSENLVRKGGKIAIIGGGAAGITAAVALARACPDLDALDLFERSSGIMALQHGSRRFLHPHFYDWPAAGSDAANAGLPIMNWTAGPAGDVAAKLRAEFEAARRNSILTLNLDQTVTRLVPSQLGPIRVVVDGGTAVKRIYDIVILAIGFGLEAYLDGETPTYWAPSGLAAPIHTQLVNPLLFISGNGDGGLVDFLMAAFNALDHQEIGTMLMGLDFGPARFELETIEREAWAAEADFDLLAAYRARLTPIMPAAVWSAIIERLRPAVRIHLHTREQILLRRTSALHNRLAAYLVLEADRATDNNTIIVTTGADFDGEIPKRGPITLIGQDSFEPFRRFLRLGPDSTANLAPFNDVLTAYLGAAGPPASETRPESPALTASATARFTALGPGLAVEPDPPAPAAVAAPLSISLTAAAAGAIIWSCELGPNNADQIWSGGRSVALYIGISAADAAPLAATLARLGAHGSRLTIYAKDTAGWRASLEALCSSNALPGPDLEIRCPVVEWQDAAVNGPALQFTPHLLAATIQSRLDCETLRQLHSALYDILGPVAAPTGWPIEPTLRARLWEKWGEWHAALAADDPLCRRFLRLLVSQHDRDQLADAALVGVGPKTLRPFMSKSTIFALAFAVCSGMPISPTGVHPGNVVFDWLTGHSCGVSWINERRLSTLRIKDHAWSTSLVLLSHLQEAVRMIEGDIRLDRSISDLPAVGTISASEEPLIIGADEGFVSALEAGDPELQNYFQSILRWRNATAVPQLEEVNDDAA